MGAGDDGLAILDVRLVHLESHLRELMEQGFSVSVIKDATAAAIHPELGDGYKAALTNFGFLAESVITTSDAVDALRSLRAA